MNTFASRIAQRPCGRREREVDLELLLCHRLERYPIGAAHGNSPCLRRPCEMVETQPIERHRLWPIIVMTTILKNCTFDRRQIPNDT